MAVSGLYAFWSCRQSLQCLSEGLVSCWACGEGLDEAVRKQHEQCAIKLDYEHG